MSSNPVPTLPNISGGLSGLGADAQGLGQLIDLLFGKSSTQTQNIGGSTQTTTNIVDQAAIEKTIRDMLEGPNATSGLAAIFTGEKASGGYGGSSSALLTSDLVSRIVGEVAKLTSSKVVTNSGQTNTTTNSTPGKAKEAAGMAAAMSALKKAMGNASQKSSPSKSSKVSSGDEEKTRDKGDEEFGKLLPEDYTGKVGSDENSAGMTEEEFQQAQIEQEQMNVHDMENGPGESEGIITIGDITPVDDTGGDTGGDITDGGDDTGGGGDIVGGGDTGDGSDDSWYTGGDGGDYGGGGEEEDCFITTAVTASRGLPDNCPELQILRTYRDNWLKQHYPNGIKMYYKSAPQLVKNINRFSCAEVFYDFLYTEYILPAIGLILLGKYEEAYNKYRAMVVHVQKIAG